jgi:hypothetical protein
MRRRGNNMYINPFICGVISTILVEITAIIGCAIHFNIKEKNK